MGKRYILALVLMTVVMVLWSVLFGNRLSKQNQERQKQKAVEQSREESSSPTGETTSDTNGQAGEDESVSQRRVQQIAEAHVQTDNYDITLAVEPAIAKKWSLRKYADRSDAGEPSINLIPRTAQNCLALQFLESQLKRDAMRAVWQIEGDKTEVLLTSQNSKEKDTITLSTQIGDSLKVSKTLTFYRDEYFADLKLTFQNLSSQPFTALQKTGDSQNGYLLRWGPGINADLLPYERKSGKGHAPARGAGAKAYTGYGKPDDKLGESHILETVLWAGLNSKYFATLMIPDPALEAQYRFEELTDNGTASVDIVKPKDAASLLIPGVSLAGGQSQAHYFRIYVGPKDTAIMNQIQAPNAPEKPIRLSKIIDLGFFWPIALGMKWMLDVFYSIIKNYGIAIILLTALVKVISYPLTRKSYKSMKQMQKLQPEISELREKHRDDPQKLNKATMQLYKEHKINPLSGCIPWIPQIPIFWALFEILRSSVELRGAPFFLWITDLSAPDALFALPFTIPLVNIDAIRLLPIINGVTTFLQQKMTGGMTPTTDNTQAKIMQFLPLIFVFVFYNWASGFVLYWLCNNVLTIGQQYLTKSGESDETTPTKVSPTKKQSQPKKRNPSNTKRRQKT